MGGLVHAPPSSGFPPSALGSWRDCSAQFLVGLIRFNYNLPGWAGDKLQEKTSDGAGLGAQPLLLAWHNRRCSVLRMRGYEGGQGWGGGEGSREETHCGRPVRCVVVVMALGSVMLCGPRRGAGRLGRLGGFGEVVLGPRNGIE